MTYRYQEFTSPGTWERPSITTFVDVTVVGGGSFGQTVPGPILPAVTAGGSGAVVKRSNVPVNSPVSITIGAGGTSSAPTGYLGGTSSFGSIQAGPGFVTGTPAPLKSPLIPIGGGIAGADLGVPVYDPSNAGGYYGAPYDFQGLGGRNWQVISFRNPSGAGAYYVGEDWYATPFANAQVWRAGGSNSGSGGIGPNIAVPPSPAHPGIVVVRWYE